MACLSGRKGREHLRQTRSFSDERCGLQAYKQTGPLEKAEKLNPIHLRTTYLI